MHFWRAPLAPAQPAKKSASPEKQRILEREISEPQETHSRIRPAPSVWISRMLLPNFARFAQIRNATFLCKKFCKILALFGLLLIKSYIYFACSECSYSTGRISGIVWLLCTAVARNILDCTGHTKNNPRKFHRTLVKAVIFEKKF